jgi:uncharacterized protein YkwD
MKLSYQIFIIFFVILSLFIIKDDIRLIVKNTSIYLNKKIDTPTIKSAEKNETQLPSKISMPGALRVVDNLLNNNSSKLSKDSIIDLTNKYRKENGNLPSLKENADLDFSADKKLKDMFNKQYFEHMSPLNIDVGDLGKEVGYEYIIIGENLAMGNFKDDQSLVDAWMASQGHRENILNKNYIDIGVAVGMGNFKGKSIWMAVQHFGTEKNVCPSIDQVLYGIISINQAEIEEMSKNLSLRREMINKNVIYEGDTYSEQINKYNLLINPYNELLKDTKKMIEDYNNQIRAFNLCILKYQ